MRVTLTADSDCKFCEGAGVRTWKELRPGAQRRYGGPSAPTVGRRSICSCVRPMTTEELKALRREDPDVV